MTNGNDPIDTVLCESILSEGLTKREYFAGLVMQGFAAGPEGENATIEGFAKYAVKWADALIDALNKEHS